MGIIKVFLHFISQAVQTFLCQTSCREYWSFVRVGHRHHRWCFQISCLIEFYFFMSGSFRLVIFGGSTVEPSMMFVSFLIKYSVHLQNVQHVIILIIYFKIHSENTTLMLYFISFSLSVFIRIYYNFAPFCWIFFSVLLRAMISGSWHASWHLF